MEAFVKNVTQSVPRVEALIPMIVSLVQLANWRSLIVLQRTPNTVLIRVGLALSLNQPTVEVSVALLSLLNQL